MNKRTRLFFDAYFGQARLQAKVAAEMAGLRDLRQGYSIINRFRPYYDSRMEDFRTSMQMSPDEVVETLTSIARNDKHKDCVRAAELVGKIHGLFNEKLTIKLDRTELSGSIQAVLMQIVQAGTTTPATPPTPNAVIAQQQLPLSST